MTGVMSEGMLLAGTNNACGCQIVFVDDIVPEGPVNLLQNLKTIDSGDKIQMKDVVEIKSLFRKRKSMQTVKPVVRLSERIQ